MTNRDKRSLKRAYRKELGVFKFRRTGGRYLAPSRIYLWNVGNEDLGYNIKTDSTFYARNRYSVRSRGMMYLTLDVVVVNSMNKRFGHEKSFEAVECDKFSITPYAKDSDFLFKNPVTAPYG